MRQAQHPGVTGGAGLGQTFDFIYCKNVSLMIVAAIPKKVFAPL